MLTSRFVRLPITGGDMLESSPHTTSGETQHYHLDWQTVPLSYISLAISRIPCRDSTCSQLSIHEGINCSFLFHFGTRSSQCIPWGSTYVTEQNKTDLFTFCFFTFHIHKLFLAISMTAGPNADYSRNALRKIEFSIFASYGIPIWFWNLFQGQFTT